MIQPMPEISVHGDPDSPAGKPADARILAGRRQRLHGAKMAKLSESSARAFRGRLIRISGRG
jgi:hypothetical protein